MESNVLLMLHRTLCLMTSVKPCNNVLFGRSFAKYCSGKPPGPANQLARQRMDEMYAAIDSVQQPPQWLKPAIGFMMDMHIPLATSGCTSLSNAYRTKLAPDLCAEYPVTLRDNERAMQTVWDCTNPSGFSNLQRLLRKGGPFQSSVRYVQSQLKRGLETPLTQKYVATVCRLSFLGAYPHCAVIASPARRIAVYTTADKDVMQLCRPPPPATTVGSHAYFYMIAEYVSSASLASPSIWAHIKKDARYTAFDRTVRHAADAIRGGKKPPRMSSAVSPRVWTPKATAATFVHAAGVRKKLSLAMITLLGPATIEALYRAAVESTAFSIAFLLQDIVGAARAQSLAECASDAQQKAWLQSLPATTRAAVQVACHGLECRSAVQLMPMHEHAAKAQKKAVLAASGKSTYFVTVCRACGTFRNKGVVSGVARARIGIQVNLPLSSQESFACNGCGHSARSCPIACTL